QLDERRGLESAESEIGLCDAVREEVDELPDDRRVFASPVGDARHDLALVASNEIRRRRATGRLSDRDENGPQIAVKDSRIANRDSLLVLFVVLGERVLHRSNRQIVVDGRRYCRNPPANTPPTYT